MGKGIDLAREAGAGIHADVLDDLKDQLLVVFLKQLRAKGHPLSFSVAEVDDTGQDLVSFHIINGVFQFVLSKKS